MLWVEDPLMRQLNTHVFWLQLHELRVMHHSWPLVNSCIVLSGKQLFEMVNVAGKMLPGKGSSFRAKGSSLLGDDVIPGSSELPGGASGLPGGTSEPSVGASAPSGAPACIFTCASEHGQLQIMSRKLGKILTNSVVQSFHHNRKSQSCTCISLPTRQPICFISLYGTEP